MPDRLGGLAWIVAPALVTALAVAACGRAVAPIGAQGQTFVAATDESALWASAEKEEQMLLKRAAVVEAPALTAYLARVADALLAKEVRAADGPGLRFVVLLDPTLNAFAMPNGWIGVHTGLLTRLENESQLAAVLAREIAHVTHRHALVAARAARGVPVLATAAAAATAVGASAAGPPRGPTRVLGHGAVLSQTANAILGLGLPLATMAAIDGYGTELETAADRAAVETLVRAGYDPRQAPRAFEVLLGDAGDRGPVETFRLGKRASLEERIVTLRRLVADLPAPATGGITTTEEFERRRRPLVRDNAMEDIRLGRFALAQRQLDRVLEATPDDPAAHLAYGELDRLRAQRAATVTERARLAEQAAARYERAAALDPTLAEPYRQLGLLHYQRRNAAGARAAFARYLELRPDAPDARRIREYVIELGR